MTMEVDSKHVRSSTSSLSSSPYKQRMFRSISNNYRNYKNNQYFGSSTTLLDHPNKRNNYPEASSSSNKEVNIKQANSNVNSDDINHDNLISYEHLSETSWIELVLPITIFAITIIAVIFIAFILFAWIRKTFREENYHRVVAKKTKTTKTLQQDNDDDDEEEDKVKIFEERLKSSKKCEKNKNYSKSQHKMNSRKWLRDKAKQIVDNAVRVRDDVNDDVEQKLETIEFKSTPPTSPNSQKDVKGQEEEDEQQHEEKVEIEEEALKDDDCLPPSSCEPQPDVVHHQLNPFAASFVCPVALSDISVTSIVQPQTSCESPPPQSSLSFLQEEMHCIQPREEKIFKSIATSPPPFSPFVAQHYSLQQKYATTGTQTYFTKAPNSPNNLLSSQFAVLQTPTITGASSNPFILTPSVCDNKENKEPPASSTKLRNICLNRSISSFKHDTIAGGTTSSSASSPSSVISTSPKFIATSPKVNTNVLQQQNSPTVISCNESPRFNFSPKILSSSQTPPVTAHSLNNSSSPLSVATSYKAGNYFRFPDIETPPVVQQQPSSSTASRNDDQITNVPTTMTMLRKTFENLSIDSSNNSCCNKDNIILKIDEVESPEEKSPVIAPCNTFADDKGNNNYNNNYENTLTIRRARLKSISLDSDGARLVEENLTMPVEELVELASSAYTNKQISDSENDICTSSSLSAAACANNNNRFNPKNIYNLTINLEHHDTSLDMMYNSISDINMNQQCRRNNQHSSDDYDDYENEDEDVDDEEEEEDEESIAAGENDEEGVIRTPTMKYFQKKKAVSLDSDQNPIITSHSNQSQRVMCNQSKMASSETFNYYFGQGGNKNSSISVPSTPKHLTSNKLKISGSDERGNSYMYGRYSRKLGSFEENADDSNKLHVNQQSSSSTSKANLTASFQTLNVSSSNLKTLPEIMSINDFDQQLKPTPGPLRINQAQLMSSSKSGILQRRGSNHSLTLNLDGSCGNLTRGLSCSNYSLGNLHSSHLNIAGGSNYNLQAQQQLQSQCRLKKNLLQRRGSNTSLSLNIQGSSNNLNRFNSHSSLNIAGTSTALQQQRKGGLLERRNSNASLTLNVQNRGLSISNCNLRGSECSLSSVNTNQMNEIIMLEQEVEDQGESHQKTHQRKFLSTENLHRSPAMSTMGHGCHRQQKDEPTPYGSVDKLACNQLESLPVISTKPLSPQSTSEDFKIYLANIQFLQSASNILNEVQLKELNRLFLKSYKKQAKDQAASGSGSRQFNNDDILNNKLGTDDTGSLLSFGDAGESKITPGTDQRELLVKLHQEFWNLPVNYQEKPMVFGSQPKNRYKTILPNEHSRVIMQREEGAQTEPYINANYIKGHDYSSDCYIATQGPMQNTIYEYWLMVMQNIKKADNQGCQKIAMLTDFVESQRSKCAVYFPQELDNYEIFSNTSSPQDENFIRENIDTIVNDGEKIETNFNYFIVKNVGLISKNGYTIRKLLLIYKNCQTEDYQKFTVYHYWFPDWPDHRSPQDIDVLLDLSLDLLDGDCNKDFENEVEMVEVNKEKVPLPIIHCSAGIGRTGCLAAILNGLGQIRANSDSSCGEGTSVDVLGIVCNLRLQRGGMVQNSEQYELIHRSLCLYQQKLSQKLISL